VNDVPVGEFGMTALVGASHGIPTVMASGDTAMCKEFFALVPNGECAEVKTGFNATAGIMLPHQQACDLIRAKTSRALERLAEIKPYKLSEPVEIKIQLDHGLGDTSERDFLSRGAEQLPDWVFVFRGKDYLEAYKRWMGR
jgi:D-amino peptidase